MSYPLMIALQIILILILCGAIYYIYKTIFKVERSCEALKALNFRMHHVDKYISLSEIVGYTLLSAPFKMVVTAILHFIKERKKLKS